MESEGTQMPHIINSRHITTSYHFPSVKLRLTSPPGNSWDGAVRNPHFRLRSTAERAEA